MKLAELACRISTLTMLLWSTVAWSDAAGNEAWELQWHNDGFANSDNQFTNGFEIRKHSRLFGSLADTRGTPAFGKTIAGWFLPEGDELSYRETWAIGQNMQSPNDIGVEEIILNDVPYVGMVGLSNNYIAFDDRRFSGFGVLLGWVGPPALAEEAQKIAHTIVGATEPEGWDNQLDFEPLINFFYGRKRKLWSSDSVDFSTGLDLGVGNFFTFLQGAFELRIGDRPGGFVPTPTPLGHRLDYQARLAKPGATYTYLSAVTRAVGFGYVMPRDGNLFHEGNRWTEDNTVDPRDLVGQLILGLHHERPRWSVHLNFILTSDTVDDEGLAMGEDPQNSFGTVIFQWRPD